MNRRWLPAPCTTTPCPGPCHDPASAEPPVAGGRGGRSRRPPAAGQEGFTLAVLMMGLAILAIMMTVAFQEVHFSMQREKEAELIFRGEQYVEGIRLFRLKFGRYPMRLKELWESKPRVLRKKWKDPMTDSYDWGLVFLGEGGQQLAGGNRRNRVTPTPQPAAEDQGSGREPGGFGTASGEKVGPIIGVYCKQNKGSIKVYQGRTNYKDWRFTLQDQQRQGTGQVPVVPTPARDPRDDLPFGIPPLPETTPTPGG